MPQKHHHRHLVEGDLPVDSLAVDWAGGLCLWQQGLPGPPDAGAEVQHQASIAHQVAA